MFSFNLKYIIYKKKTLYLSLFVCYGDCLNTYMKFICTEWVEREKTNPLLCSNKPHNAYKTKVIVNYKYMYYMSTKNLIQPNLIHSHSILSLPS